MSCRTTTTTTTFSRCNTQATNTNALSNINRENNGMHRQRRDHHHHHLCASERRRRRHSTTVASSSSHRSQRRIPIRVSVWPLTRAAVHCYSELLERCDEHAVYVTYRGLVYVPSIFQFGFWICFWVPVAPFWPPCFWWASLWRG